MAKRKGKVFTLFETNYRISFFHKPSMGVDDTFYYIILDDVIRLRLKVFNNSIIVIDEILPLQKTYLLPFYDDFVKFLMEQTMFTVLISKLGSISCIDDSCIKYDVAVIEDERFITIPKQLYTRLCTYMSDTERYGFYLLAVIDTPSDDIVINTSGEISVLEQFKQFGTEEFGNVSFQSNTVNTSYQDVTINGCTLTCDIKESNISISDISIPQGMSNVSLMNIFEKLEEFLDICPIIITNISNKKIYDICKLREYDRIRIESNVSTGLGSYRMKQFQ